MIPFLICNRPSWPMLENLTWKNEQLVLIAQYRKSFLALGLLRQKVGMMVNASRKQSDDDHCDLDPPVGAKLVSWLCSLAFPPRAGPCALSVFFCAHQHYCHGLDHVLCLCQFLQLSCSCPNRNCLAAGTEEQG